MWGRSPPKKDYGHEYVQGRCQKSTYNCINCINGINCLNANAGTQNANAATQKANVATQKANAVTQKANAATQKDNAPTEKANAANLLRSNGFRTLIFRSCFRSCLQEKG